MKNITKLLLALTLIVGAVLISGCATSIGDWHMSAGIGTNSVGYKIVKVGVVTNMQTTVTTSGTNTTTVTTPILTQFTETNAFRLYVPFNIGAAVTELLSTSGF